MPFIVKTESGTTVRVAMPKLLAQRSNAQWVDSQKNLTDQQKRDAKKPTLIQNEKGRYTFVSRMSADALIDAYKAVEITEEMPEYIAAFKLALGPKGFAQINGDVIASDKIGLTDYDKFLKEAEDRVAALKNGDSGTNGHSSEEGQKNDVVSDVQGGSDKPARRAYTKRKN